MDSTIVAALISAISSIIVAAIGRAGKTGSAKVRSEVMIPDCNKQIWRWSALVLLVWTMYAALFLHWDLAGMSVFFIPLSMIVLSFSFPVKPTTATATALFLFPFAFAAEPIGKWKRGMVFNNHFEPKTIVTYIAIAFGTAFVVWLINRYRVQSFCVVKPRHERLSQSQIDSTLTEQIATLAKLHKDGVLSDDEFIKAKNKLLSD